MMQRFLIRHGDKTTANGTVVAKPTTIQFEDRDVAHEGDDVQCSACNGDRQSQMRRSVSSYDGPRRSACRIERRSLHLQA